MFYYTHFIIFSTSLGSYMVPSWRHFKKYFLIISITMWGAVEPRIKPHIMLQSRVGQEAELPKRLEE